jgi:tRNA (5-methylaminomethyl-2-thiouridylate)-methyltransferase
LLSGGVDSSVALRLLQEQGHNLTAFYLKIWLEDETAFLGSCPWEEDLRYARAICAQAGVPLRIIPFQKEYYEKVVSYTIAEIKAGRTPNPDIFCNSLIKFGAFLDFVGNQFDRVATGHYAQIREIAGVTQLYRSPDSVKDQTYFLAKLNQDRLKRALFPIGHLTKVQVRELAQKFDLPTKDRKDSQGICFLGKLKYNEFIKHYLDEKPGDLIEFETGKKLGEHRGFWYHTIGQRQGSGLAGGPWYVVSKDPSQNRVYLSRDYYSEDKHRNNFNITDCTWIEGKFPEKNDLQVKLRHGRQMYDCHLELNSNNDATVKLADRDQGIAPGQFAVLYDGDRCLGSGVINN